MAARRLPRLVVLDLDFTVWQPVRLRAPVSLHLSSMMTLMILMMMQEMYELDGPPFRLLRPPTAAAPSVLADARGTPITIFPGADLALRTVLRDPAWIAAGVRTAVSSRCDYPPWARQCMRLFSLSAGGPALDSAFHHIVISKDDKANHFRELHSITGIPFADMIFFDNEM
jgi:magnesium-dependent phosphatase 1